MIQIQNIINTDKTVMIVFFATWCPHCRRMRPIWERIAENESDWLIVREFDIDSPKNEALTEHYRVRSVPTMMVFKDSEPVWRESGEIEENILLETLQKYR